jgi:hypothetical protein
MLGQWWQCIKYDAAAVDACNYDDDDDDISW